jgi:hypothetical protein
MRGRRGGKEKKERKIRSCLLHLVKIQRDKNTCLLTLTLSPVLEFELRTYTMSHSTSLFL